MLRDRLTRASQGLPVVRLQNVRFDELAEDLKTHDETTGSRDPQEAEKRVKPLRRFFAGWRAAQIDGAALNRYVVKRQATGTANGTINRERSVLRKMLRLALEHGKLARLPVIRGLKESLPRSGFFEAEQYAAVRRHLPADLQTACDVAYTFGWRMRLRCSRSSGATSTSRVAVSVCARARRRTKRAAKCFSRHSSRRRWWRNSSA